MDSSDVYESKPEMRGDDGVGIKIKAGTGAVIDGWDMALLTMRLGERADIFLQPKYAFGEKGRPPKIPPNSRVIFRVELL